MHNMQLKSICNKICKNICKICNQYAGFDVLALYCMQYAKYKICKHHFQYAEYALPTLLMTRNLAGPARRISAPEPRSCSFSLLPSAKWAVHMYYKYAKSEPCTILHIDFGVCILFCMLKDIYAE